ncbi:hypothetical protein ACH5RR_022644 [Cinchona calisaya]|uniref:Uncharacterized protein n=1 Tax=Cinchona calisaya TaxID=153742 RepID=A0ABD2Z8D3_9GENT
MTFAGLGLGGVGSSRSANGFKGSSGSVEWLGRKMLALRLRDRVDHDDDGINMDSIGERLQVRHQIPQVDNLNQV